MTSSPEPRFEKYKEFQEKMRNVPTICGYDSKDVAALKYKQLLGEVLEQFKLLEENLDWRKRVEAREWGDSEEDEEEPWHPCYIK